MGGGFGPLAFRRVERPDPPRRRSVAPVSRHAPGYRRDIRLPARWIPPTIAAEAGSPGPGQVERQAEAEPAVAPGAGRSQVGQVVGPAEAERHHVVSRRGPAPAARTSYLTEIAGPGQDDSSVPLVEGSAIGRAQDDSSSSASGIPAFRMISVIAWVWRSASSSMAEVMASAIAWAWSSSSSIMLIGVTLVTLEHQPPVGPIQATGIRIATCHVPDK